MNTAINQRYRGNERHLILTMLNLMERYEFEAITITRLCKTAGLHRSTFYAHFHDINDLLIHIHRYLGEELESFYHGHSEEQPLPELIQTYLNHSRKRSYFYRILYSSRVSDLFTKDKKLFVWERLIQPRYLPDGMNQEYQEIFCRFFHAGFIAVMQRWLGNGCDTDTAVLANMILDFIPASLKSVSSETFGDEEQGCDSQENAQQALIA